MIVKPRIKGLSKYEFEDDGLTLKITSHRKFGRTVILTGDKRRCKLTLDDGEYKYFSIGFLRFLIMNPDLDSRDINPVEQRVKFSDNGQVMDLYSNPKGKRYSVFQSPYDALATVTILIAASKGDLSFVYSFISENREKAVSRVSKLLNKSRSFIQESLLEGEAIFINQIKEANVEKIVPLFAWFCRALKTAVIRSYRKSTVPILSNRNDYIKMRENG